mmetsp:Transcript_4540/g.8114  ORF Transcript_4540/g.8114 Transcript_4540/m.8114 type:complete len:255 (-) Transcript_4540:606-1370(-)
MYSYMYAITASKMSKSPMRLSLSRMLDREPRLTACLLILVLTSPLGKNSNVALTPVRTRTAALYVLNSMQVYTVCLSIHRCFFASVNSSREYCSLLGGGGKVVMFCAMSAALFVFHASRAVKYLAGGKSITKPLLGYWIPVWPRSMVMQYFEMISEVVLHSCFPSAHFHRGLHTTLYSLCPEGIVRLWPAATKFWEAAWAVKFETPARVALVMLLLLGVASVNSGIMIGSLDSKSLENSLGMHLLTSPFSRGVM